MSIRQLHVSPLRRAPAKLTFEEKVKLHEQALQTGTFWEKMKSFRSLGMIGLFKKYGLAFGILQSLSVWYDDSVSTFYLCVDPMS